MGPQNFSPGLRINQYKLFSGMVVNYFKVALGDKYNNYVFYDAFDETQDLKEEIFFDDIGGGKGLHTKLTKEQKEKSKKLLGIVEGRVNLVWRLKEYAENGKDVQFDIEIRLTFDAGRISGQGNDETGPFYWDGTYSFNKGKGENVEWIIMISKRYIGRYAVSYEGKFTSEQNEIKFIGVSRYGLKEKNFELSLSQTIPLNITD